MKKIIICLTVIGLVSCSSDNATSEQVSEVSQKNETQAKGIIDKEDFFKSAIFFRGNTIENSSSSFFNLYKSELEKKYKGNMAKYDNHIDYICGKLIEINPNLYDNFYEAIIKKDLYESKELVENAFKEIHNIYEQDPQFSEIKNLIESIEQNVDFSHSKFKDLDLNNSNDLKKFYDILKAEYNIDILSVQNQFEFLITYPVLTGIYIDHYKTLPPIIYYYNLAGFKDSASLNLYIKEVYSLL